MLAVAQVDYIALPMRDIKYKSRDSTSSGSRDTKTYKFILWDLSGEVDAVLKSHIAGVLGQKRMIEPTPPHTCGNYTSEAETNLV